MKVFRQPCVERLFVVGQFIAGLERAINRTTTNDASSSMRKF